MPGSKKQSSLPGKDCFTRMNFLYQAATLYAGKNDTLSAYYGGLCKSIARRAAMKIGPGIKRSLCKNCALVLQPGITAELSCKELTKKDKPKRQRNKKRKVSHEPATIRVKCIKCGYQRSFTVNENYNFWLDKPEAIAESISLQPEEKKNKIASQYLKLNI